MNARARAALVVLIAIVAVTALVYLPTLRYGFVFDDQGYILDNTSLRGGFTAQNVRWAFTTSYLGNWHPLTWLTHLADYRLFLLDAGRHHILNILLHLANTLLLYLVLRGFTGAVWRSVIAAGIFALHPLRVESVAWISERKDVLCAFFWLLALLAWLSYLRRPGAGRYLGVAGLFVLGLMSKPMIITLPFLLLLLDWWPLGRTRPPGGVRRVLLEKLPLVLLSAMAAVGTFLIQREGGAVGSLNWYPARMRLTNAVTAYARYLYQMAWPADLAVFYPHRGDHVPGPEVALAAAALVLVTCGVVWAARRGRGYPAVGWLWYLGTMVPVIGIVQVGDQALADRYTYVPLIGISIMAAWGLADLTADRRRWRAAVSVSAAGVLALLAVLSAHQVRYWKDEAALFGRAAVAVPGNWLAYNGLALALARQRRYQEALPLYREALRIFPGYYEALNNMGLLLNRMGRRQEGIDAYREAIRLEPRKSLAYFNLGLSHVSSRDKQAALDVYRRLASFDPGQADRLLAFIDTLP